jgi:translation initiation factor IF-3
LKKVVGAKATKVLKYRINDDITASEVRLIGIDGEALGILSISAARAIAAEAKMDLAEVSSNVVPPTCRLMDYSKTEYEAQKKQKRVKKNSKSISLKELRMRPCIGDGDYQVKLQQGRKFLESKKYKLAICIMFRGRELDYPDRAFAIVKRLQEDLIDVAKIEAEPKLEKRRMHMMFGPL